MRICVVTPFDEPNPGAFLQAYALKRVLESAGHEVVHLQLRSDKVVRRQYYRNRPSRYALIRPSEFVKQQRFQRQKYRLYRRDQQVFTEVTVQDARAADVVVLGSDEIWNVRNPIFRNPAYFGHGFGRVVAYAPSIGRAVPRDYRGYTALVRGIGQMSCVMARDRATAQYVESLTSCRPPLVLDPTLLHEWTEPLPRLDDEFVDGNRYLAIYSYSSRLLPVDELKIFAQSRGLKLVSFGFLANWCDHSVNCSPLEFLDAMKRADYVFTTTFHGTIAAILGRRRFLTIPAVQKTEDLLERLHLEKRTYRGDLGAAIEEDIDYQLVLNAIEEQRSASLSLLERALATPCR